MCAFTCDTCPGYLAPLQAAMPGTPWLGLDGEPVTVGGLVLGAGGIVLLGLAVSGLWLSWPCPGRVRAAFTVRRGRGRFARDTDLHRVIGVVALPLLLLWGVTGAGFEFGFVKDTWYAVTPGPGPVTTEATSDSGPGPDVGIDEAVAVGSEVVPDGRAAAVNMPPPDDPTATYTVWLARGVDPYAYGDGEQPLVSPSGALSEEPRRAGPQWSVAGMWVLQLLLLVQFGGAVAVLVGGHRPASPALFLAYAVTAVALPVLCQAGSGRAGTRSASARVADLRIALACAATVVVQWRLATTWMPAGG